MTDLSEFFSNVDAATQPRGRGKLMKPPFDPYQNAGAAKDIGMGAANFISPAATSLASGEPPAPIRELPSTPQKVPGTEDRRYTDAAVELAPWAIGAGPMGGARAGVSAAGNMAAKFGPRAVRFAPAAEAAPSTMARDVAAGTLATAGMSGEANAQPAGSDIRSIQMQLKQSGDYKGPIDGKWGPLMEAAQNAANERKQRQDEQAMQLKNLEAQASLGAANAKTKESEAQIAETERLRKAKEKADADREAGMQRLREVETNLSPTSKAIRSYSGPGGYGLGVVAGGLARAGVVKGSNYLSNRAARKAEDLFMREGSNGKMAKVPAKTDAEKVARVNEFARKGGGEEPFLNTPAQNPGFAVNPDATPFNKLYPPNRAANMATDIGIPAAFGAEAGWAEMMPKPEAHAELLAATEAANKDPSEINIQRLQDAKDSVALWEGVGNLGRGGAMGYGSMALKMKRAPTAPNMAPAEAEKMSLEKTLRGVAPSSKKDLAPTPKAAKPSAQEPVGAPGVPEITTGQPLAVPWPGMRLKK
jgi:peptidoglycan hydrolase-like protein with peptidoglycan-binding domain